MQSKKMVGKIDLSDYDNIFSLAQKLTNTLIALQPCEKCKSNNWSSVCNTCDDCYWQNIGTKNKFREILK